MVPTLIIPGLHGSGADHWQSWWQALEPGARRVDQPDWETPDLARWAHTVAAALQRSPTPVWLVAHSFGCLAAVVAAQRLPQAVAGAFLVAPADPDIFEVADALPQETLPFPVVVVGSSNDPWITLMKAGYWAHRWGGRLVGIGPAGHINVESGYGPWIEGRVLFQEAVRSQDAWPGGDLPLDDSSHGFLRHRRA